MNTKKKLVIKVGSSVLAPGGYLDCEILRRICQQIAYARKHGWNVCLVTSGAIASGVKHLKFSVYPKKLFELQASAAVGQGILMAQYSKVFSDLKLTCAQILLTWDDFQERKRYVSARRTLITLLERRVVPIINENDTIATDEIKFGDNDRLSALVAGLVDAEILIILSDVEGVYAEKGLIKEVQDGACEVADFSRKQSLFTRGGMGLKVEACRLAVSSGVKVYIASGAQKNPIIDILNGENPGTVFYPLKKIPARKRWIAFGSRPRGKIIIDEGAKSALLFRSGSLLSVGIREIKGDFHEKEPVLLQDMQSCDIGVGLVSYSSEVLRRHLGKSLPREVVHRDNIVFLSKK